MELRESEALRVEYHHHGGVGHVHAHLDDGGCDENLRLARYELLHLGVFLLRLHLAVYLAYLELGEDVAQRGVAFLEVLEVALLALGD